MKGLQAGPILQVPDLPNTLRIERVTTDIRDNP